MKRPTTVDGFEITIGMPVFYVYNGQCYLRHIIGYEFEGRDFEDFKRFSKKDMVFFDHCAAGHISGCSLNGVFATKSSALAASKKKGKP